MAEFFGADPLLNLDIYTTITAAGPH